MLEETQDHEEIIERDAALDIGKAEVVACVRVPSAGRPTPSSANATGASPAAGQEDGDRRGRPLDLGHRLAPDVRPRHTLGRQACERSFRLQVAHVDLLGVRASGEGDHPRALAAAEGQ